MKIRNGFVSNSSSSSFILAYNKNRVLTDPKDIVDYVKQHPDKDIILNGGPWNEGDDIFELDENWKSLIRKFPLEFIKTNTGTQIHTEYEYHSEDEKDHFHEVKKQIPKVTAYVDGVILTPNPGEYKNFEVDMSDVENAEVDINEWSSKNTDPDVKRRLEISDNWYRIQDERERKARQDFESDLIQKYREEISKKQDISIDDVVGEIVWVSNGSCDPDTAYDGDFAERYLTMENYEDYEDNNPSYYHIHKRDRSKACPFVIFYDEALTDKNEISDYISNSLNTSNGKVYLVWTNPVYNFIYENDDRMFDFYEIGEKEAEIFINNKDSFFNDNREATLFTNANIVIESGSAPDKHGKLAVLNYGRIIIIPKDSDVKDFKKNVKGN